MLTAFSKISDTRTCSKISWWGAHPNSVRKSDNKDSWAPSPPMWIVTILTKFTGTLFPAIFEQQQLLGYKSGKGSESWEICSHISNHHCYFWCHYWVRKQPSPTPIPDSPKGSSPKPFMYPPFLECWWLAFCSISLSFGLHPFLSQESLAGTPLTAVWCCSVVVWKVDLNSSCKLRA